MGKRDLVLQSSLIAIGTVKSVEEGSFGIYKQKAYVEITSIIKGNAPKNIAVLGQTWFICDLTNLRRGNYIFFIKPADSNYVQNGIFSYYISPGYGDGIFFVKDQKLWWHIGESEHENYALYSINEVVKDVINISHVPWGKSYFSR